MNTELPATRLAGLQEVLDLAIERQGADSEAARILRVGMDDILTEMEAANDDISPPEEESHLAIGLRDSPVLLVGLGAAVVMALMGFSTMFIGMLAAKWLTL